MAGTRTAPQEQQEQEERKLRPNQESVEEKGPFIVNVNDSSDNHYAVGPFSDKADAEGFANELSGQAGMLTESKIVSLWDEDDILKLYPATEPLIISEDQQKAKEEEEEAQAKKSKSPSV